jgi:hypothetical protein
MWRESDVNVYAWRHRKEEEGQHDRKHGLGDGAAVRMRCSGQHNMQA